MDYNNQTSKDNYINRTLYTVAGLLLILYVVMAVPKLPNSIVNTFNNKLFILLYMFLIYNDIQ